MKQSFVLTALVSAVLGLSACSKEEPEGTAEQMGKKIDEAAESMQKQVSEAAEATQEQAAETRAEIGAALEEKGKEMQGEAGTAGQ
jgi:uncharacterized lipoprotein